MDEFRRVAPMTSFRVLCENPTNATTAFLENSMRHLLRTTSVGCGLAVAGFLQVAAAQTPAPTPQAATGPAVASPTYTSIPLEIAVNKPAADVWKRVGKFCDIGEWLQIPCTITSGKDGEFGAVRSVAGEVLVGKTELSYTYTQTVRNDRPYNLYHGTLEARPVTATTSKIVYTIFFDNSMLADDAAREADKARRTATFQRALQNMKTLAEGGTLPPPPARGRGAQP
jgi:Polyketide cyclase / dehydrase and lipid transport